MESNYSANGNGGAGTRRSWPNGANRSSPPRRLATLKRATVLIQRPPLLFTKPSVLTKTISSCCQWRASVQPEKFFVGRNSTDGACMTLHRRPRAVQSRGVCGSCGNKAREWIKEGRYTDLELVAMGYWLPKDSYERYVREKSEKQSA